MVLSSPVRGVVLVAVVHSMYELLHMHTGALEISACNLDMRPADCSADRRSARPLTGHTYEFQDAGSMHLPDVHGHPDIIAAPPHCYMLHMYSLRQDEVQGTSLLTLKKQQALPSSITSFPAVAVPQLSAMCAVRSQPEQQHFEQVQGIAELTLKKYRASSSSMTSLPAVAVPQRSATCAVREPP
jgi:hypothetical protein